jgi:HEAT repeat protein
MLESKAMSKKERLQALHDLFRAKETLLKSDKIQLWQSTKTLARDKQEDHAIRANAIWAFNGMGMLLKHEKVMTQEEVSREGQFLMQVAVDEAEDVQLRRLSIAALGDLKMKESVPILKSLLLNKTAGKRTPLSEDDSNLNRPEILRAASVALTSLAPDDAVQPVGKVLNETADPSVFGTAAYALGRTGSGDALPLLVTNRSRLGDNLSVDNAIGSMSTLVMDTLKNPTDPNIVYAIKATHSLWRKTQKDEYTPLLQRILADKTLALDVRKKAITRLMEDADSLSLDLRKQSISAILPLVEPEEAFQNEIDRMRLILNARLLPIMRGGGQDEKEVAK